MTGYRVIKQFHSGGGELAATFPTKKEAMEVARQMTAKEAEDYKKDPDQTFTNPLSCHAYSPEGELLC